MPELIGRELGAYRVVAPLGIGAMASTYVAEQPSLGRQVALKVLHPHLLSDPEFVRRFELEARTAAQLEHPHIVPIYDVGQAGDVRYIAMRLVSGASLAQLARQAGPLPLGRAAHLVAQIAEALDYAHAHGVVHRDVKPHNVLVEAGDRASLADFGIARAADGGGLTRTGALVGTPAYLAPESVRGEAVGPPADQYALGVLAFELLAGRVPFAAQSDWALLQAQVSASPPSLRPLRPDLPPAVDGAIQRALAKDPSRRFPSCAAFASALGAPVGVTAAAAPSGSGSWPSLPAPVAARRGRSGLAWIGGAAAAALAVIGLVIIAAPRSGAATTSVPLASPTVAAGRPTPPPAATAQPRAEVAGPTALPAAAVSAALAPGATSSGAASATDAGCAAGLARVGRLWGSDLPGAIAVLEGLPRTGSGCAPVADKLYAAYVNQGLELAGRDQPDAALALFGKAAALNPGRGTAQAEADLATAYRDGKAALASGAVDRAVPLLEQVVRARQDYAGGAAASALYDGRLALGNALLADRRSMDAASQFQSALELRPGDADASAALARATRAADADQQGWIVFSAPQSADSGSLWAVKQDGSQLRQLPTGPGLAQTPDAARQGGQVVYCHTDDARGYEIFAIGLDDGPRQLTSGPGAKTNPRFSPDGGRVAFVSTRSGQEEIWVMDASGGSQRQLTSTNGGTSTLPAWSPDGGAIVYSSGPPGRQRVWTMDANGGNQRPLSSAAGTDFWPSYLPDGRILFRSVRGGQSDIAVMDADGSGRTFLTDTTTDEMAPATSPSGRRVVYTLHESALGILDLQTGETRSVGLGMRIQAPTWVAP